MLSLLGGQYTLKKPRVAAVVSVATHCVDALGETIDRGPPEGLGGSSEREAIACTVLWES